MSRRLADLLKDPWFAGTVAAIGLVFSLLYRVPGFQLGKVSDLAFGFFAGFGLTHYYLDSRIWRVRHDPELRQVLRMRGHRRWFQFGLASAVIGLILVVCSLLSLVLFGAGSRDAGATGSVFFGFLLYGWLLASAVASAMIPAPDPARPGPPVWSIAALLLAPTCLIAGCQAGAAVLPG